MGLRGGVVFLAVAPVLMAQAAPSSLAAQGGGLPAIPWTLRLGPQLPSLVRYNRVEAVSVGVRAQLRPGTPVGPLSLTGTVRVGGADRHLNGRLDIAHESVDRRIVLSGYHELAAIDERARHFGAANTLLSLLAGRDDGDYYRRSGARLEWTPPTGSAAPVRFRYRLFYEYHERVSNETDVQLPKLWDEGAAFRDNVMADEGWEYGGSVEMQARYGSDPTRTRGGVSSFLALSGGPWRSVRASLGADMTFALPSRMGLSLEAAAGWSDGPSAQRLWYVGGPLTLRGHAPRVLGGEGFGRGRVEVYRSYSFGRAVLFSDLGWAGDPGAVDPADALTSAGVGLAIIDGLLRIDGAWQLESPHDFRLDIYLDQIL